MDKNEIKKALYRENPNAYIQNIRKDGIIYQCRIGSHGEEDRIEESIYFLVPLDELGETVWGISMEAKLLIRWLSA